MSTYLQLKQSIDSWVSRDDIGVTGEDMPEIMLIVESRLRRNLRSVRQEKSTVFTAVTREIELPADCIEVRAVYLDTVRNKEAIYMTPEALRAWNGWDSGRVGARYTYEGGENEVLKLVLASAPSATDPLDVAVLYWAKWAPLVADTDTNWLLANHFDAYLYASLVAACEITQETVLEDRYERKYLATVEEIIRDQNRTRLSAAPKQVANFVRPVV